MKIKKEFDIKKLCLKKNKKTKIGIVFSGGGARGFVHVGVIKALEEFGLKFDMIVGTSAGSIVGALYASGMNYSQIYEISKKTDMKDIRTNIIPYQTSKTEGIEKVIIDNIGDIDIKDLKTPFVAVCTDLISTKEFYVTKGSLAKAVAGSCCLPYVFYPVEFLDKHFVDGGLHNTIPSDIPKLMGCDYVIAVDANPSRERGTESTKLFSVLACSFRILMLNSAVKGYKYADLMLKPETKRFKMLKTEGFDDLIEEGYKVTIDNISKILEIYNRKPLSSKQKILFVENYKKSEREVEKI